MSTRAEYRDRLIETMAERDRLLAENAALKAALEKVVENLSTTDTGNNNAVDEAYHIARAALKDGK